MGLHPTKIFIHNKSNNKMKRQHMEWRKVFENHVLISAYYPKYVKHSHHLININLKCAEKLNKTIFSKKTYKWPMDTRNRLNILIIGDAKQNHNEI